MIGYGWCKNIRENQSEAEEGGSLVNAFPDRRPIAAFLSRMFSDVASFDTS